MKRSKGTLSVYCTFSALQQADEGVAEEGAVGAHLDDDFWQGSPHLPDAVSDERFCPVGVVHITAEERDMLQESERLRVAPEFNSTRYGIPTYCQLADASADEIKR